MAEALYRKYRPTTFSDVVGQEHIERTLKNAIEQDKVSHAYLFCGPRGTGKTTTARILAKALLCEQGPTINPDGTCQDCLAIAEGTHPDVYELDAASRTGVENVREEIISRVHYAPTRGAYKIYIIDEVHMLSSAAFNALLKTLEEPPSHVVFVLCTTDPQEVPETIQSRCQRFDFHRISADAIVAHLGAICVQENVEFEPEALELIAQRAEGGMRNALTSLEQLIAFDEGKVSLAGAQNLLGAVDNSDFSEIVGAIARRDAAQCFEWTARYLETGADLAQFCTDLAQYFRNLYLLSITDGNFDLDINEHMKSEMSSELACFTTDRISRILTILDDAMRELRVASNARLTFEIGLTRMVRPESDLTLDSLAERIEILEERLAQLSSTAQHVTDAQVQTEHPSVSLQPKQQPSVQQSPVAHEQPSVSQMESSSSSVTQSAVQVEPSSDSTAQPVSQDGSTFTATVQSSGAGSLPIDLSNQANLQRFWHAVTTSLRKSNPARGVLFMNAHVSFNEAEQCVVVEFATENNYAFLAAQKKEVRELLQKTMQEVTGVQIPHRLVLKQGEAAAHEVADQAPASVSARTPQRLQPESEVAVCQDTPIQAPSEPKAVSSSLIPQNPEVAPLQDLPAQATPAPASPVQEIADPSEDNEDEQIKAILTASFGAGIKFEDVDE